MQLDGKAGAPDLLQQRVEAVEARLWHELGFVAVAAHGRQQLAHLGERRPTCPLDIPERIAVLRQRIGEFVPDGADLKHHHAHGVGDDVVELARDPGSFLGHRDPCRRVSLPLGQGGAHLRRFGLLDTLPEGKAGDPGDRELQNGMKTSSSTECPGML